MRDDIHCNRLVPPAESPYATIERLTADLAAARAERGRLQAIIERDRTAVAMCMQGLRHEIASRDWLAEGCGSYEWDDEKYQEEFGRALDALRSRIDTLSHLTTDWSDCPAKPDDRTEAQEESVGLVARAHRLRADAAEKERDVLRLVVREAIARLDESERSQFLFAERMRVALADAGVRS